MEIKKKLILKRSTNYFYFPKIREAKDSTYRSRQRIYSSLPDFEN